MKVALNLSIAPSPSERYALAWAAPVFVVALVVLVLLSALAVRNYREYRKVHVGLRDLQASEARLRERETALRRDFERPGPREALRGVQFVNALIDQRRFSLTELTAQVTALLPPDVRLAGLALVQGGDDPVVRFAIVGKDEEVIEEFLTNLEDSANFHEVAIVNQGFEAEGSAGGPVTIACTAHYRGERQERDSSEP